MVSLNNQEWEQTNTNKHDKCDVEKLEFQSIGVMTALCVTPQSSVIAVTSFCMMHAAASNLMNYHTNVLMQTAPSSMPTHVGNTDLSQPAAAISLSSITIDM
ncbi:hypothetical protein Cfor_07851 [Coptotermes formosanus]|uniref:Uncharacterized protein n=1 Tax=Coptotermes formosanus TaxID=36987 RepID=A0A6L2PD02_COPFO|nr:hypothetical protein Cfor_07851 [Coptotermes formosanus]